TFWGKERFRDSHEHHAGHEGDPADHETSHHHVHEPHESPASMWVPLAVLALFATIGGFIGITTAFTGGQHVGGRMNNVNCMYPIIFNPHMREYVRAHEAFAPTLEA